VAVGFSLPGMEKPDTICSDCGRAYLDVEAPPCSSGGSSERTIPMGMAAEVDTAASIDVVVVRRLMTEAQLTLLGVVTGIAVTVGGTIGAAIRSWWPGAVVGLFATITTAVLIALLFRWRRSHYWLRRAAENLWPGDDPPV